MAGWARVRGPVQGWESRRSRNAHLVRGTKQMACGSSTATRLTVAPCPLPPCFKRPICQYFSHKSLPYPFLGRTATCTSASGWPTRNMGGVSWSPLKGTPTRGIGWRASPSLGSPVPSAVDPVGTSTPHPTMRGRGDRQDSGLHIYIYIVHIFFRCAHNPHKYLYIQMYINPQSV